MAGNQYKADPRQALFLKHYLDPKSDTFANALQSGIKAGFTEEYSKTIISRDLDWVSESIKDEYLVKKAEKKLNDVLDMPAVDQDGKVDNQLIANQMKGVNLVLKGLAKDKYSERRELTGKDGGAVKTEYDNEAIKAIAEEYEQKLIKAIKENAQ